MPRLNRPRNDIEQVLDLLDIGYTELALRIGASAGHTRKVVQGSAKPSVRLRKLMASALNVNESALFKNHPQLGGARSVNGERGANARP
jgi:hypothetical protein